MCLKKKYHMSPWNFNATAFQESHKKNRKIFMIFFGLTDWDGNQHLCVLGVTIATLMYSILQNITLYTIL